MRAAWRNHRALRRGVVNSMMPTRGMYGNTEESTCAEIRRDQSGERRGEKRGERGERREITRLSDQRRESPHR